MAWREDFDGLGNAGVDTADAAASKARRQEASDVVSLAALNDLLAEAGDFHATPKAMLAASRRLQDTAGDLAQMMAMLEAARAEG